jgi:prepilin signal peptidase PulO-like enzyme (type II secretory pathway)
VAVQNSAEAGSVRNAVRWGLLLAAVGTAGFRLPRLVNEFRAWREALGLGDPSAAEGLGTVLEVDAISVLIVVGIALGAFYLLRPKAKSAT